MSYPAFLDARLVVAISHQINYMIAHDYCSNLFINILVPQRCYICIQPLWYSGRLLFEKRLAAYVGTFQNEFQWTDSLRFGSIKVRMNITRGDNWSSPVTFVMSDPHVSVYFPLKTSHWCHLLIQPGYSLCPCFQRGNFLLLLQGHSNWPNAVGFQEQRFLARDDQRENHWNKS